MNSRGGMRSTSEFVSSEPIHCKSALRGIVRKVMLAGSSIPRRVEGKYHKRAGRKARRCKAWSGVFMRLYRIEEAVYGMRGNGSWKLSEA